MNRLAIAVLLGCLALVVVPAAAADLYPHDDWSSLATDHRAHRVGDLLTILVYESSAATNTATTGSHANTSIGGQLSAGSAFDESGRFALDGSSDNTGSTGRSGGMVAQISVAIKDVLPNGDLHVAGAQLMNINGERTNIRIEGRVRQADISAANTVMSNRLADAVIDYDGNGFVSRSAQPGIVTRVLRWLGIP